MHIRPTDGGGFHPWDNYANVGAISKGYFHASDPFKTSPKLTGRFELVPKRCPKVFPQPLVFTLLLYTVKKYNVPA